MFLFRLTSIENKKDALWSNRSACFVRGEGPPKVMMSAGGHPPIRLNQGFCLIAVPVI